MVELLPGVPELQAHDHIPDLRHCAPSGDEYQEHGRDRLKPTVLRGAGTAVLLVWSVISLAGISTFIYFSFKDFHLRFSISLTFTGDAALDKQTDNKDA